MLKVKWILFDFGGCLDSDGMHSRTLFLNQFIKYGLVKSTRADYTSFQEAYTHIDAMVIENSLIVNSTLLEMNRIICLHIAQNRKIKNTAVVSEVAESITQIQSLYLTRNRKILRQLSPQYQLGIISNFSGNLMRILEEFSLASYFSFVMDSFHIGLSKPNPAIFKLAIKKCNSKPREICFVGDNKERDITPANNLGMKTILISPILLESRADYTLASLKDIFTII